MSIDSPQPGPPEGSSAESPHCRPSSRRPCGLPLCVRGPKRETALGLERKQPQGELYADRGGSTIAFCIGSTVSRGPSSRTRNAVAIADRGETAPSVAAAFDLPESTLRAISLLRGNVAHHQPGGCRWPQSLPSFTLFSTKKTDGPEHSLPSSPICFLNEGGAPRAPTPAA